MERFKREGVRGTAGTIHVDRGVEKTSSGSLEVCLKRATSEEISLAVQEEIERGYSEARGSYLTQILMNNQSSMLFHCYVVSYFS